MARPERLQRLDVALVARGLAPSRARAVECIEAGQVEVDGLQVDKPARQVRLDQSVRLVVADHGYVGRGALKLLGVLDPLGVDPAGCVAADLGASTGGFTEVLLERGAQRVYAVDVGHGQLAWRLQTDPRVVNLEGTNVRTLQALPEPVSLIVGDLSFISLRLVLPAVARLLAPDGRAVLLVKPQFEAGREAVGKGGRVDDAAVRDAAIARVKADAVEAGFVVLGEATSPLPGAKAGNVEHFLLLGHAARHGQEASASANASQ